MPIVKIPLSLAPFMLPLPFPGSYSLNTLFLASRRSLSPALTPLPGQGDPEPAEVPPARRAGLPWRMGANHLIAQAARSMRSSTWPKGVKCPGMFSTRTA